MPENAQSRVGRTEEPVTPATLVEEVSRGSRRALKQLYDVESRRLFGIALRLTRRPEKAAGVLKDAFVHVWQSAGRYSPAQEPAEAWLTGIVRQHSIAILRKAGTHAEAEIGKDTNALAALNDAARESALRGRLAELDPKAQRALVLAFADGLSYPEIAVRLSEPLPALMALMRSSLESLGASHGP